jgi:hypothetical protein
MASTGDFAKMVPGFDFLQGLMKNAGSAIPGMGQWIAPTLDPDELEKRIEELRTVQFWLEQNARMLGATIQALEVQRMTLSTLKTMNMPVAEMTEAFRLRPGKPAAPDSAPAAAAAGSTEHAAKVKVTPATSGGPAPAATGAVLGADPVQWWGALTKQFTELAAKTLAETMPDAARAKASSAARKTAGKTRAPAPKKRAAKTASRSRKSNQTKRGG